MSCALLPGTETTMLSVPCCCTFAPVKPCPFTRLFRIAIDCDIWLLVGVVLCGATALIVKVVPLDRSRPRPTLNLSCQLPGCRAAPPRIVASMTISSATRIPRYRHGRETSPGCLDGPPGRDAVRARGDDPPEPPAEPRGRDDLLLGGATCACP